MPPKKRFGSLPVVVFAALSVLWGVEVLFFYDILDSATEERDRLVAREQEKVAEKERLERRFRELDDYTTKMIRDSEFVGKEAREILGGAEAGEIVIRPEET